MSEKEAELSKSKTRQPSTIERILGVIILLGAIAVLVLATTQWIGDTNRIRAKATIHKITTVAPVKEQWTLDLPAKMKDPRSVQIWDYADSQNSLAAQDAATGVTAKLTDTQNLILVKGTDGKAQTQAIALIDVATGQAIWNKTYDNLPLDYCLNQLWQSSITCESDAAKKVVRIDPTGNVTVGDLPNGIWDLATGEHVIGAIHDRFLVVPIGVGEGGSAGAQAAYVNPDFTWKGQYQLLVPNAQAAQPIHLQTKGSVTLLGVLTADTNGENRLHTWGYSQSLNLKTGSLDTAALGPESQVSLLEAGFFASASLDDSADQIDWQIFNPDGTPSASGKAPKAAVQAMHTQLRAGLPLDTTAATAAMQSGKVPAIMPDRSYLLTAVSETCNIWPGCASKNWSTGDGVALNLKAVATPLTSSDTAAIFTEANGGMLAYGTADGKFLWEGVVPPLKEATTTGDVFSLGEGFGQLAQLGSVGDGSAKAVLRYLAMP